MNHLGPEDRKYLEQKAFRTAGSRGQKVFRTAELFIESFQFFFNFNAIKDINSIKYLWLFLLTNNHQNNSQQFRNIC